MADRPLELTPEERALLERAETEACGGLSFDFEAGLADVRARAHPPGSRPVVPRQRSGSASVVWRRIGAVATIVAALGAATGYQLAAPEDAKPPALSAPPPLARDRGDGVATSIETSRPTSPGRTADSTTPQTNATGAGARPGPGTNAGSGTNATDAAPRANAADAGPRTQPAPRTQSAPPTKTASPTKPAPGSPQVTPKPGPPTAATPTPGNTTAPASFRVRYPATWLTVLLDDTEPQTLNLAQPKIVDDGPVRITTAATGDPVLANTAGVLAATIPTDDVTPADCAEAIHDAREGDNRLALRDDRTYCLMTPPDNEEPQTLVRVDVKRPDDGGEIKLCVTAWDRIL